MRGGIAYDDALEMSPIECDRTLAILSAWAIPPGRRVGGTLEATAAQIDDYYDNL